MNQHPINGAAEQMALQLQIVIAPHQSVPTRMCTITIQHGAVQFAFSVDWASLPKLAQALADGQKQRPLVELARAAVPVPVKS